MIAYLRQVDACALHRRDGDRAHLIADLPPRGGVCGGPLSTSATGDATFLVRGWV
jgi:hypothetical protein